MLRQDPTTNKGGEYGPVSASGFAVRTRTRTVLRCLKVFFFLPDSGQTLAKLLTLQTAPDFSCSLLLLAAPCCFLLHLAPSFSFSYTPSFRVTEHAVLLWAQLYTNEDDISWRKFTLLHAAGKKNKVFNEQRTYSCRHFALISISLAPQSSSWMSSILPAIHIPFGRHGMWNALLVAWASCILL